MSSSNSSSRLDGVRGIEVVWVHCTDSDLLGSGVRPRVKLLLAGGVFVDWDERLRINSFVGAICPSGTSCVFYKGKKTITYPDICV